MKKINILLLVLVSVQCFGQETFRQKQIDLIAKSYCDSSVSNFDYKSRILRYNIIDEILSLKKYANEILSCYNPKTFDRNDYYIMSFFDSIPKSIIDSVLTHPNLPSIFRAKYGSDTIVAENLLNEIKKYFFSEDNEEISDERRYSYYYIGYLFLLNSEEANNILYRIIESKKYTKRNQYDVRQNYNVSLSYIAIQDFLWFYPPDEPISDIDPIKFEVKEGHNIFSIEDINQSEFEQYKRDVEKYIYIKKNKKITINVSFFNLGEYRVEKYISY